MDKPNGRLRDDYTDFLSQSVTGYSMLLFSACVFLYAFYNTAWVSEDAYILFRSLEQLFSGNGPIWNPNERVQVFTSPLWYWVLAIPRVISEDQFLNIIIVSLGFFLATFFYITRLLQDRLKILIGSLLLCSSNAFVDYASGGLENVLGYFLLAYFLFHYHQLFTQSTTLETNKLQINKLAICYGLLIVTRHDLALLLLPPLLYIFGVYYSQFSKKQWAIYLLKASFLLVAWSIFSLIYYGSIFPNTAYAKLNTGIEKIALIGQGITYFKSNFQYDLLTLSTISIAIIWTLSSKSQHLKWLVCGIILNLIYILYVGGDFMRGRFFSYAFLISTLLLFITKPPSWFHLRSLYLLPISITVLVLYNVLYAHTPLNSPSNHSSSNTASGVTDERGYYYESNSLRAYLDHQRSSLPQDTFPQHEWCDAGREFKLMPAQIYVVHAIGMVGYCSGLQHTIIDPLALTDPFLSRLPIKDDSWRIGHFEREIPQEYLISIDRGKNHFKDEELSKLYNHVQLITTGDELFSEERLKAIFNIKQ